MLQLSFICLRESDLQSDLIAKAILRGIALVINRKLDIFLSHFVILRDSNSILQIKDLAGPRS